MLKSQLLEEKNRLTALLQEIQSQKGKLIASPQKLPDAVQNKIREMNQKILELQEEIKAVDLKLY